MSLLPNFHNARLSLVQSAFRHFLSKIEGRPKRGLHSDHELMKAAARALDQMQRGEHGDEDTGPHKLKAFEVCVYWGIRYALAKAAGHHDAAERYGNKFKFNKCDPGWLEPVCEYIETYWIHHDQPHYVTHGDDMSRFVYDLPASTGGGPLKVGILGDWGTGEEVAAIVLNQLMALEPDVIIHVGDIYYSGTDQEAQQNFLDLLNKARADRPIPIYNLPGNHDYYTGGTGFYGSLPELNAAPAAPPGTPVQEASYWCLRNEHWHLHGLDTGFYDHDVFKVGGEVTHLHTTEAAWHRHHIQSASERKVVLFSHHQYFTALGRIGGKPYNEHLRDDLGDLIEAGQVAAWFWGHEHLFEVHDEYLGLAKGRCIGHGAFPVTGDPAAYEPKNPDVPLRRDLALGVTGGVYNHGFALMTLDGESGTVDYYEVPGDGSEDRCWKVAFSDRL